MDIKTQMLEIAKKYYIVTYRQHELLLLPSIFYPRRIIDEVKVSFSPRTYDLTDKEAENVVEKIAYQLWASVVRDFEAFAYKSKIET